MLVMATKSQKVMRKSVRHVLATVVAIVFFVPILVALITSLKSNASALTGSVLSLPHHLDFSNYRSVFDLGGFATYTKVSTIVSVGSTIVQVAVATCAGYGFAKLRFRGRGLLFMAVLLTLMLPPAAVALPLSPAGTLLISAASSSSSPSPRPIEHATHRGASPGHRFHPPPRSPTPGHITKGLIGILSRHKAPHRHRPLVQQRRQVRDHLWIACGHVMVF